MNWTKKQKKAIETRDRSLLVSAAAGSGKTAVLVERVIRLITEDQVDVDELLVVTFTKAAASEMKAKILKAIKDRIKTNPEDSFFIRKQIEKLAVAQISTFHSFALELIKNYFYMLEISPRVNIGDEGQIGVLKNQVLNNMFEENFEANKSDFLLLLDNYSSVKSHEEFKKSFLDLYDKILAMPKPVEWLEKAGESLRASKEEFLKGKVAKYIVEDSKENLTEAINNIDKALEILRYNSLSFLKEKLTADKDVVVNLLKILDSGDLESFSESISLFKFSVLKSKKDEQEVWESVKNEVNLYKDAAKKAIKNLRDLYFFVPLEDSVKIMNLSSEPVSAMIRFFKEFHDRFRAAKRENNLMDFNDIEHFAVELLENNYIAEECKAKYKYIFVDEYQDSNLLQESIIEKISSEDNLFLVGDLKQSIYRFRLAEPDIFKERYGRYEKNTGKKEEKIDLNQNFRSKQPVINAVNKIFSQIMKGYKEGDFLVKGTDSKYEYDFPVEFVLQEKNEDKSLDSNYFEAYRCAELIKENCGRKIFDHKKNTVRTMSYRDMVILMRSTKTKGKIFAQVMAEEGIPVYAEDSVGYFDTPEINGIVNMLEIIDKGRGDLPLLSILRWPFFDFSTEDLVSIRKEEKDGSFTHAFKAYKNKGGNREITKKINRTVDIINNFRQEARYTPIDELVWKILEETGYYTFIGGLPSGEQRQINLRAFLDKVGNFAKGEDNSVHGLLNYFKNLKKTVEVGQESILTPEEDVVEIMTIHKSKGLEFPLVIVAGLSGKFNSSVRNRLGSIEKDLGFSMACVGDKGSIRCNTIVENAIRSKELKAGTEEEIRVFYVAATRAMDKLIFSASLKDIEKYRREKNFIKNGCKSYLDFILNSDLLKTDNFSVRTYLQSRGEEDENSFNKNLDGRYENKIEHRKNIHKVKTELSLPLEKEYSEYIKEALEKKYSYEEEVKKPSKLTVSQLNNQSGELNSHIESEDIFPDDSSAELIKGASLGSLYHKIMELIDFKSAGEGGIEYIEERLTDLKNKGIINKKELASVSSEKIKTFFDSEPGQKSLKSPHFKEKSFVMKHEKDNISLLIQGVIDCYFYKKDGSIGLIDYKTNRYVENIEEVYREQMYLYKEALEKGTGRKVTEGWLYLFEKNMPLKLF